MKRNLSKAKIEEILDSAEVIGPYEFKWPCYDCNSNEVTHSCARSLKFGHVWLCRECARKDVADGITVFRLSFVSSLMTGITQEPLNLNSLLEEEDYPSVK